MSTNQTAAARGVSITYAPGALLSVPIIADEDDLDQLYTHSRYANGLELRALALHLGITEPSQGHQWAIGWDQPDGDRPARLVWYDPEKLAAIDEEIEYLTGHCGPGASVEVTHGPSWDSWDVVITNEGAKSDPWAQAVPESNPRASAEPDPPAPIPEPETEAIPAATEPPSAASIQVPVTPPARTTDEPVAGRPMHLAASAGTDSDAEGPRQPEPSPAQTAPADQGPRSAQGPAEARR